MPTKPRKLSPEEAEAVLRQVLLKAGGRKRDANRRLLRSGMTYPVCLAVTGTIFRKRVTLLAKGDLTVEQDGTTQSGPSAEDLLAVVLAGLGPRTQRRILDYLGDRFGKVAKGNELPRLIPDLPNFRAKARALLDSVKVEKIQQGAVRWHGRQEPQRPKGRAR